MTSVLYGVLVALSLEGQTHRLSASPETVAWGYYDAKAKPVLSIASDSFSLP
jgi:hypothetical protein